MKKSKKRRPSWRDIPDSVLLAATPIKRIEKPESLNPSPSTIERAIMGHPEAMAIIDSYAFRFPVVVL
jgi:hypothetical protein